MKKIKQKDNIRDLHLLEIGWKTIRFNKTNIDTLTKMLEKIAENGDVC